MKMPSDSSARCSAVAALGGMDTIAPILFIEPIRDDSGCGGPEPGGRRPRIRRGRSPRKDDFIVHLNCTRLALGAVWAMRFGRRCDREEAMRLTNFSDYALRLLMYVAARDDRLVTNEEAAEGYGIPERQGGG